MTKEQRQDQIKNFKPTYLYIKTHNVTGLKYFGCTTQKNPYKYKGGGLYWKNHCKVHGYDYSTEILGYFTDYFECKQAAIYFSLVNDIVNSNKWANLIIEQLQGGSTCLGKKHTEETKEKMRLANLGQKAWNKGKSCSESTRIKLSNAHKGKKLSDAARKKLSESLKGKTPWNKNKPSSKEICKKLSNSHKNRWLNMSNEEKENFGKNLVLSMKYAKTKEMEFVGKMSEIEFNEYIKNKSNRIKSRLINRRNKFLNIIN